MGKFHIGRNDSDAPSTEMKTSPEVSTVVMDYVPSEDTFKVVEKIVYVDRPVEVIKEVQVETIVEKIVEVPGKTLVEYKTVEVPVMYEKEVIKEVPVYIEKEVVREVRSKVIDITEHLDLKRMKRKNKALKVSLILSIMLNVLIMVVK